jgi:hypothetical protein
MSTIGKVELGVVGANSAPSSADTSQSVSLLASPENSLEQSADPGAMLAVLTMKTAKAERQAHTAMRLSEEATQDTQEVAQVEALREKAKDMRTGAWVSGLATVGSSIAKGIGSGAAEGGARAVTTMICSGALKGGGEVGGGIYKANESVDDANATEHEHLAAHAKRAGEDERDAVKDAKDLMDKAIEFYKEYSSGKNQAMAAATHRA